MGRIILLTIFYFILFANVSLAKCASYSWSVLPESGEIPRNQIFILQGYGSLQGVVETLTDGVAYLQSEEGNIPLKIDRVYHGQMNVSQAILRPSQLLKDNATYNLYVPSIEKNALSKYDFAGSKKLSWRVSKEENKHPLAFLGKPKVVEERYILFGCGPEIEVDVSVKSTDDNAFAEVELRPLGINRDESSSYMLPIQKGVITIGHGMCSGAFILIPEQKYSALITLINPAGIRAENSSASLEFLGPIRKNSE